MPIVPQPPNAESGRQAVRARYAHHVWMTDLTEIPGLVRLFSSKLAVVFDVFSRVPLAARVFLSEPSAAAIARLFRSTAFRSSYPPRRSASDQGSWASAPPTARPLRPPVGAVRVSAPFALRFLDPEKRLPCLVPRAA